MEEAGGKEEVLGLASSVSVSRLAAAILTHLLLGDCFSRTDLPPPAFFTDYIFHALNCTTDLQLVGKVKTDSLVVCSQSILSLEGASRASRGEKLAWLFPTVLRLE